MATAGGAPPASTTTATDTPTTAPTAFNFGPWACDWSEAFCLTPLSLCLVNQKPIVPGHVLIIPRRVVPAFEGLTLAEAADLMATAHAVAPRLRRAFGGAALTLAVQDGLAAGQTVPHVHMHVLPRREGDFVPNDKVYDALDAADMARKAAGGGNPLIDAEAERKPRTRDEMAAESAMLRPLFADLSLPIPPSS
jgi:bis(5'-adenosyl)-triphosphatase